MAAIRFLGWSLSKVWRRMFGGGRAGGVAVEEAGLLRLRQVLHSLRSAAAAGAGAGAGEGGPAVVYLPTHKSHVDYLLLSYVCFR